MKVLSGRKGVVGVGGELGVGESDRKGYRAELGTVGKGGGASDSRAGLVR